MKKFLFFTVTALSALAFGCNKIKSIANINVDIPYNTQVSVPQIPGDTYGVPIPGTVVVFPTVSAPTNSQQYLNQYHTSSSNIVQIDLKSLFMQILSPATQNFDFLDTVQLYMSAPMLPEVLMAYQYNIPKGSTTLNLTTITEVDMKSYFLADTMYLRMRTYINAVPASGTQLNIATTFHMIANPLD